MNISDLRESDLTPKEEGTNGGKKISENPNLMTSSWTKLKDPRIVRVSRAFGGKDRHSKVCTVRGLRDRRVRLSVPTAIQLYDLQDRLGLNQPSKVVDWLLDVAKNEIDELPPLQFPLGNFVGEHQGFQSMINNVVADEKLAVGSSNDLNWEDCWNNPNKSKQKDAVFAHQSSNQSSSLAGMFNNHGSFLKLDPSNLSLSQLGSYTHHQEDAIHNFNVNMYPQQPSSHDHNSRDQFEMVSSSSSNSLSSSLYTLNQGMIRPFHLSMNPNYKLFPNEEDKGN